MKKYQDEFAAGKLKAEQGGNCGDRSGYERPEQELSWLRGYEEGMKTNVIMEINLLSILRPQIESEVAKRCDSEDIDPPKEFVFRLKGSMIQVINRT